MNEQTEYIIDSVITYMQLVRDQWQADDLTAFDMAREVGSAAVSLLDAGVTQAQLDQLANIAVAGLKAAQS